MNPTERAAALAVCERAADADEARELLAMLGLIELAPARREGDLTALARMRAARERASAEQRRRELEELHEWMREQGYLRPVAS